MNRIDRMGFVSCQFPKPRKRKGAAAQQWMILDEDIGLSSDEQEYASTAEIIRRLRLQVDQWRMIAIRRSGGSRRRRNGCSSTGVRPFFCQIEAAETTIWLTEVAPDVGVRGVRRRLPDLGGLRGRGGRSLRVGDRLGRRAGGVA
jgi:hypothetical protein